MPIFVLMIKAELENVGKFWASEEHVWELDVQQSAGAEIRQGVQIDPDEQVEIPNSNNATANFLLCLLYTSPSPRDGLLSRMPSSA